MDGRPLLYQEKVHAARTDLAAPATIEYIVAWRQEIEDGSATD
ncbi:hypothetical protein [Luteitalea sp.]|nr:hypothetical protein [Luteitalea sp.]